MNARAVDVRSRVVDVVEQTVNALTAGVVKDKDGIPKFGAHATALVASIVADEDWNSRSNEGQNIELLLASIQDRGLLNPLTVRNGPNDDFLLVAGSRRLACVKRLKWEWVPITIVKLTEADAKITNLAENIARESLRLYDTMRFVFMLNARDRIPAARIARETGLRYKRVRVMIDVWPRLSPWLKQQWSKVPDTSYEPNLSLLQSWTTVSYAEQDQEWKEWSNDEDEEGVDYDFSGINDFERMPPHRRQRQRVRSVKLVTEAIKLLGKTDQEQAQKRALLWAIGRRETF